MLFQVEVLQWVPPREVTFSAERHVGIAYADAFSEMDGTQYRPVDLINVARVECQFCGIIPPAVGVPSCGAWPPVRCGALPGSSPDPCSLGSAAGDNTFYSWKPWPSASPRDLVAVLFGIRQLVHIVRRQRRYSQWTLTSGYSRDFEANAIVSLFWIPAAFLGSHPWFEGVRTNAQLADAVPRGHFAEAERMRWKRFDADLAEVWGVVLEAVDTHAMASEASASAVLPGCRRQLGSAPALASRSSGHGQDETPTCRFRLRRDHPAAGTFSSTAASALRLIIFYICKGPLALPGLVVSRVLESPSGA